MKNYMFLVLSLGLMAPAVVHAADVDDHCALASCIAGLPDDTATLLATLKEKLNSVLVTAGKTDEVAALSSASTGEELARLLYTDFFPTFLAARNAAWKEYSTKHDGVGIFAHCVRDALLSHGVEITNDADRIVAALILMNFGTMDEDSPAVAILLKLLLAPLYERESTRPDIAGTFIQALNNLGRLISFTSLPLVMVVIEKLSALVDAGFDFDGARPTVLKGSESKGSDSGNKLHDVIVCLMRDAGKHVAQSDLPLTVDSVTWHVDTVTLVK